MSAGSRMSTRASASRPSHRTRISGTSSTIGTPSPTPRIAAASVHDEGRALDLASHPQLVPGHQLVAHDADRGGDHPEREMRGAAVGHELVVGLPPGEEGASPDRSHDEDPRKVLRPAVAVGVAAGGPLPGGPEPEVDADGGEDVTEVVQRVG